jgi:hypothetical protein
MDISTHLWITIAAFACAPAGPPPHAFSALDVPARPSPRLTPRGIALAPSLVVGMLMSFAPTSAARGQEAIAIIVHPRNRLAGIQLELVRRLYLGRSASFPDGQSVTLVESPALRSSFYPAALGMNEDRFKRHWIGVVFSGEAASPPRDVGGIEEVLAYVSSHAEAIAYVPLSTVRSGVKVLAVDGASPSDPGYPLRVRPEDR